MAEAFSVITVSRYFSDFVNRVVEKKEHFILLRDREPIAELRPVSRSGRLGKLSDLLVSLPKISPEEAEEFAADLADIKNALSTENLRDPWSF